MHYESHPTHCHESSPFVVVVAVVSRSPFPFTFQNRQRDRQGDYLNVKKKRTKANLRTIRTRLCLSFCACQKQCLKDTQKPNNKGSLSVCLFVCVPARNNTYPKERQNPTSISFLAEKCLKEDKTKKNKNMSARQKMFARRKKTTQNEKTSARKKNCLQEEERQNQEEEDVCRKKCFFVRRKTKKPMTRSRAQVCIGWVLYSGALLVRSRFRIGEDQFLRKFVAIARNKKMKKIFFPRYNLKMGMLSLSLSTVVQFKKSLGCAAPRRIPVTETEEKLAAYDPRLIYRRESRACM